MSINKYYIFRSSELFLFENNRLPDEIPADLAGAAIDTLDLLLSSSVSRAVLLADTRSVQSVVTSSVSNTGEAQNPANAQGEWVKLRTLMASSDPDTVKLAKDATRALGLLNWHNTHRYCTRCGGLFADHPKETARVCTVCRSTVYPRLSPAIIVLVQKEGKILLARHTERNQDVFSCIAGYVEHGETLEECVSREVFEETGIQVQNIRYEGSQSWPYPDQYMIGFYADWKSGEICIDPSEILEACWFERHNLPNYPMPGTVAWRLINGFLNVLSKKRTDFVDL